MASLLLFPFSKSFLARFEFLFFNLHTSQPLYTLHPPFAKAAWPFCKGHLVGKAFVKRLACGPRLRPKSCRHEHMWVVSGWGGNKTLKVQLRCMVTRTTQPPQETPAARSNHFAQVGWSVPGAFVLKPLKKCCSSLVKELLCEERPLAIPFCKGKSPFSKVYMRSRIHCRGGLSLTHNEPFLWAHPYAKVIPLVQKCPPHVFTFWIFWTGFS